MLEWPRLILHYKTTVMNILKPRTLLQSGVIGIAVASLALTSCEDPNAGKGAVWGAVAGAGIGAIAGDNPSGIAKGAAIGAGVGALAGAYAKAKKYKGAGGSPGSGQYPVGSRTNNPNIVKSPYSPYNAIDVTGFRSGELAIDPTTNKVFQVP